MQTQIMLAMPSRPKAGGYISMEPAISGQVTDFLRKFILTAKDAQEDLAAAGQADEAEMLQYCMQTANACLAEPTCLPIWLSQVFRRYQSGTRGIELLDA